MYLIIPTTTTLVCISCMKTHYSCPYGSESHTWKLCLHYGDFVQADSSSKMVDKTAGTSTRVDNTYQLELTIHVN